MGNSEKTVEIKNNSERNIRYDFIRGILMLGVIIQHVTKTTYPIASFSLYRFLNTYDMPLFMLISGYFLKLTYQKYNTFKNILNKFTQFIVPLILWCTIFFIIRIPFKGASLQEYIHFLSGRWYLWAAFICTVITLIICQITENTKIRLAIMVVISICTLFIPKDPFHIAYVLPFFFIGFFFDLFENLSKDKKTIINFVSICAFIVLLCFWDGEKYNTGSGSYILENTKYMLFVVCIRFFIALFGCMAIMTLCDVIMRLNNKISGFFVSTLSDVGKNTLAIYLLQAFFIESCLAAVMPKIVNIIEKHNFPSSFVFFGFVAVPILSFIAVVIINVIAKYIKKIPKIGKYLFGFKVVDARIKNNSLEK